MSDLAKPDTGALQGLTDAQVDDLLQMDVNNLTLAQRNQYLWWFSKRMGLDPMTRPFDCIPGQNGKVILYANRNAAEQLRKVHNVNLAILERGFLTIGDQQQEVFIVRCRAELPDGRTDESLGAVPLRFGADPESMANAVMKAETKAKRRATLSIMAIGLPDETEVVTIPGVKGEVLSEPRRIFPQQTVTPGATVTSWQPQPVRTMMEVVNKDTGEVVDAEQTTGVDTPADSSVPAISPAPAAGGRRYPPAVPPVSLGKK